MSSFKSEQNLVLGLESSWIQMESLISAAPFNAARNSMFIYKNPFEADSICHTCNG